MPRKTPEPLEPELRRTIADLATLSELPAAWASATIESMAQSMAEALIGMLGLEFVFVRAAGLAPGEVIETARRPDGPLSAGKVKSLAKSIQPWLSDSTAKRPAMVHPFTTGTVQTAFVRHGVGDVGIIFAGAKRSDFPSERDRLILRVAANHIAVAFQRFRAVNALKASEATFQGLADTAPMIIWVSNPDGAVTFHSAGWQRFTGQAPGASLGDGWLEAVHPSDRPTIQRAWKAANERRTDTTTEYRLRRADGEYRWVLDSASPRFGPRGEFLGYVGTAFDINDRRKAEEALEESQRQALMIAELVPQLIWICDAQGRPIYFNRRWYEFTGMTDGQPEIVASVTHPDDRARVLAAWKKAVDTGHDYECEYRLRRADGGYEWVLAQGLPLRDENGRIVKWFGSCTNVDAQRRARQRQPG